MKVLQVNCVYGKGSTGKITKDLHHELLSRGIDSVVCYGRGDSVTEPDVYKTCPELYSKMNNLLSRITGIMYGGCFFSTNKLISIIRKEQPDVVHLQCINGYFVNIYRLLNWLKNERIPTVVTLHAEFMYTGGCGHSIDCTQWSTTGCGRSKCPCFRTDIKSWFFDRTGTMWKKMRKAFSGFDKTLITSVSSWLMERAKQSPFMEDKKHCVVMNGLNTGIFHPYSENGLRTKYALSDRIVIFHATPHFDDDLNSIKGGGYVIELAKRFPNYEFVVAGDHEDVTVPDNMLLLGRVSDQTELAKWYSTADLTVITSKRETFSMIVAESLCCGTPVVGFMSGGPESIAIKEYCNFAEYGDIDDLAAKLHDMTLANINIDYKKCEKIYSSETMAEAYIECYYSVVSNEK